MKKSPRFHISLLSATLLTALCLNAAKLQAQEAGAETSSASHPEAVATTKSARVLKDIPYRSGQGLSESELKRCKLDLYLPEGKDFPTLVWFHGGGLKEGSKTEDNIPKVAARFAEEGIAVVAANYRFSPKVLYPAYIEDAAAAVAWTLRNIAQHGGSTAAVFVGGHSAGGYLALMVGMNPDYLNKEGLRLDQLAGLIPFSGQVMTHYTVRGERGIDKHKVTADEAAPVFYNRKGLLPLLVLYADHDFPAREEENAYFVAIAKDAGNKDVTGYLAKGRTHGSIAKRLHENGDPVFVKTVEWIRSHVKLP